MKINIKASLNSPVFVLGIIFTILGIKTIKKPIYYFRGANVDFTGFNIPIGSFLVILGIVFICLSFYNSKSK